MKITTTIIYFEKKCSYQLPKNNAQLFFEIIIMLRFCRTKKAIEEKANKTVGSQY